MRWILSIVAIAAVACGAGPRGAGLVEGTKPDQPNGNARGTNCASAQNSTTLFPARAPSGVANGGAGGALSTLGAGAAAVAGASGPRGGASGTRAAAGSGARSTGASNQAACVPGGDCTGDTCCGTAPCVQNVCAADCSHNEDCVSGCCLELKSGESVCAPSNVCPPPDAPDCVRSGADCSIHSCCGGVGCVENVCSSACANSADCQSGCCFALSSGQQVCAPSDVCGRSMTVGTATGAPPASGGGVLIPITTCNMLKLVADDGTFLGNASSSTLATNGVCNDLSQYGSQFGSNSIHNQFGNYGSEFASMSAYNQFASTPPRLRCESGEVRNPVTKNTVLGGAIDPDVLCDTLAANGY